MIRIHVASNEQKPYLSEELGYDCVGMQLKSESGHRQTGDYLIEIDGRFLPYIFERKSLEDFYGSTIIDKNRKRLYAEIERFTEDERFDRFIILVESSKGEYLKFMPFAVTRWHQKKGDLAHFRGVIAKKKVTVLEHLKERGAEIYWCGDRAGGVNAIRSAIPGSVRQV